MEKSTINTVLEMLFIKDNFVYSESLNEKLAPVYEKRGKAKELSKKANEAKLHKAKTDRVWKEEYNRKLSDAMRGNKNHRYGKPALNKGKKLSNEVRERMRLASIKREAERKESGYYLEKYPKKDRNVHEEVL